MAKFLANPSSYTFNAAAKTLTFTAQIPSRQGLILSVTRAGGGIIYQPEDPDFGGTWAAPVLTFLADTTAYDNADDLKVWLSDGLAGQPVTDNGGSITVDGPLTDTQLRAAPVPVNDGGGSITVDGPLTDAQLRNTPISVSGPATDAQIRATPLQVSGPLTDTQLRSAAVPVSGPLTDEQIRATPLAVTDNGGSLTVDATSLPLPTGASTEATLVQVRDAIRAQIDIASSVWTDNSGAYYVRRDLVDQDTGTITVSFTDPSGTTATPGAGLRPLSTVDRDVTQTEFDATASGTGYSSGDLLARVLVVDANATPAVVTALWVNLTTGAAIGAPTGGTFERANESIGARQVGTWTVAGPLTDAQLRAAAVPVSGTFWQATQPVSGPLTNAELRAADLPVSGPLTNAELRATPIPVSGTFSADAGTAGDNPPLLPPNATGQIGWLRSINDVLLDSWRQILAIANSVKPFRLVVDPATQQVRAVIATLPTLGTVTTVTTCSTLTNQAQIGGLSASTMVIDSANTRWATTVRPRIVVT
jgi:hypothetical protein